MEESEILKILKENSQKIDSIDKRLGDVESDVQTLKIVGDAILPEKPSTSPQKKMKVS